MVGSAQEAAYLNSTKTLSKYMLSTPAVGLSLWRCCYSPGMEFSVWSLLLPLSEGRQERRIERVRASQDLHPRPTRDARSWRRNGMIVGGNGVRGGGGAEQGNSAGGNSSAGLSAVSGASSAACAKRRNQHCRTCGYKMRVGAFKRHHNQLFLSSPGPICTVPESRRRVKVNPIATRPIRMFGSECHCVGDDVYPGGCSST